MIVDCHTHIWESPDQLGQLDLGGAMKPNRKRMSGSAGQTAAAAARPAAAGAPVAPVPGKGLWRSIPAADPDHHWAEATSVDKSIVLGFKSRYLQAEIPNRFVAEYVRRFPQKLIGFAGIDPTDDAAVDEVLIAREELKLRGVTISPANQDFHPSDSRAMDVYAACERLGMPVLFHPSGQFTEQSKLEYGRPYLLDEVARSFPNLRMIIAQIGQPWVEESIVMLGKHRHVFADVSGLLSRPWQAYNALVSAHQAGVIDKLLFGSDFPYTNATECIEALYSINQMAQGTNLPVVPREMLRGIVERDSLGLLGLG
ncbi:amidohydrolase family protein [Humisphaera borealis]|uniref:Amidohydrolase n=1 Tax=Humisphaera borealis TaxID=2807512 RepID=A0A7M2WWM3_9BACT|nr:amidohydrolase family protein [Humisphaera borealis]QOV89602.1 amidohydrolase [Humisphaera borealis]